LRREGVSEEETKRNGEKKEEDRRAERRKEKDEEKQRDQGGTNLFSKSQIIRPFIGSERSIKSLTDGKKREDELRSPRKGRKESSSPRSGSTLARAAIPREEIARFTDRVGSALPFSDEGSVNTEAKEESALLREGKGGGRERDRSSPGLPSQISTSHPLLARERAVRHPTGPPPMMMAFLREGSDMVGGG